MTKRMKIHSAPLAALLIVLLGGCSVTKDQTTAGSNSSTLFKEGREFQAITTKVEMPIRVDEFRSKFNQLEAEKLKLTIAHFQSLVEWALVLRHRTVTFAVELSEKKEEDQPLSGKDLEVLCEGIKQHLALREEILSIIYTYRGMALHDGTEPWLIEKDVHAKATVLAIAAALVLYDNFAMSTMAFQDDSSLRRLTNRSYRGFDIEPDTLKKVMLSYHSPEKRKQVRAALEWLANQQDWIKRESAKDTDLAYLQQLIESSPSKAHIEDDGSFSDYTKYVSLLAHRGADNLKSASESSMDKVSKGFGNTVGLVAVRKGKLYGKLKVAEDLRKVLKPLDVLLEKTPFRLTDKFIPGHFGHVAIWVGTPSELKAMGLWEHPLIKPNQKDIADGKQVLEALREGVVLNSIEHFLNIDDIAILRLKNATAKQSQEMLVRSFRQLGKEYDFNFDVETLDKIVCSELVYAVYTHITWPTEKALGRVTISPDNVAVMALEEKPFEMVLFYHDGSDTGTERYAKYKSLIETDQ